MQAKADTEESKICDPRFADAGEDVFA